MVSFSLSGWPHSLTTCFLTFCNNRLVSLLVLRSKNVLHCWLFPDKTEQWTAATTFCRWRCYQLADEIRHVMHTTTVVIPNRKLVFWCVKLTCDFWRVIVLLSPPSERSGLRRYCFHSMCVLCVCVSVHSGTVNQTSLKRLKLWTSNLTCMFPVRTWPLKSFSKGAFVKIHLEEICTLTSAF